MLPGEAGKARILICMTLETTEFTFDNLDQLIVEDWYSARSKMFCTGCGWIRSLQAQLRGHLPQLRAAQATPATQTSDQCAITIYPYKVADIVPFVHV